MMAVRGGAGIILFGGCGYWPVSYAPVNGPTPMHIWAALTGLSGLSKKKTEKKVGREMCWKDMGELEEGMGINISFYACMEVSKIKRNKK